MGQLYMTSVYQRDYSVLMGSLLVTSVMVVAGGLVTDALYALLDPRIRYE